MDVAVYGALSGIVTGEFKAGHFWLGARDGAVDITDMKYSQDALGPQYLHYIHKARALLREGKLLVPERQVLVDAFQPPDL
jgi:basic membrane lipoprotein Med (substrate-binding protein (PBP1-ABC) superfamily)